MQSVIFHESGLQFTFPRDWNVFKYDEHRFYRYLSGEGLKGVDFIAIKDEQLYFIEVKNYTERFYKVDSHPMEALLENPNTYVVKFQRKFEDTIRLLNIIEQYYNRKWWYRNIFLQFKSYFSKGGKIKTEIGFWSKAIELLKQPENVSLILWLELAPEYLDDATKSLPLFFQKGLQEAAQQEMKAYVVNTEKPFENIKAEIKKT